MKESASMRVKYIHLCAAAACLLTLMPEAAAQLSGHVYDAAAGTKVTGLAMTIIRVSSSTPLVFPISSDNDGAYSVDVPPGNYRICVDEGRGYLDPCQWQLGTTDMLISGPASLDLQLISGTTVTVAINDSDGVLAALMAGEIAQHVPVTVDITGTDGTRRLVPSRSRSGKTYLFSLLVPKGQYTLQVSGGTFSFVGPVEQLQNASGYSAQIDTSATQAALPPWVPRWLQPPSTIGTLVPLSLVADK